MSLGVEGARSEINMFQAAVSVFETEFPPSFELFWPWSRRRYVSAAPELSPRCDYPVHYER